MAVEEMEVTSTEKEPEVEKKDDDAVILEGR